MKDAGSEGFHSSAPLMKDAGSEGFNSSAVHTEYENHAPLLSISELLNMHHLEMEPSGDTGSSSDLTAIVVNLEDTPLQATPTESDLRVSRTHHPLESMTQATGGLARNATSHESGHLDDHDGGGDDRECGDDDLTDVTATETESDDDDEAPPPLPMSPIPELDTPTHTLRVVD